LINRGRLVAGNEDGLRISGPSFINEGLVQVQEGSSLHFSGTLVNQGRIDVTPAYGLFGGALSNVSGVVGGTLVSVGSGSSALPRSVGGVTLEGAWSGPGVLNGDVEVRGTLNLSRASVRGEVVLSGSGTSQLGWDAVTGDGALSVLRVAQGYRLLTYDRGSVVDVKLVNQGVVQIVQGTTLDFFSQISPDEVLLQNHGRLHLEQGAHLMMGSSMTLGADGELVLDLDLSQQASADQVAMLDVLGTAQLGGRLVLNILSAPTERTITTLLSSETGGLRGQFDEVVVQGPASDQWFWRVVKVSTGVMLLNSAMPEPSSWALMALGLAGIGLAQRSRKPRAC
jgi:PEP-CTERM motif